MHLNSVGSAGHVVRCISPAYDCHAIMPAFGVMRLGRWLFPQHVCSKAHEWGYLSRALWVLQPKVLRASTSVSIQPLFLPCLSSPTLLQLPLSCEHWQRMHQALILSLHLPLTATQGSAEQRRQGVTTAKRFFSHQIDRYCDVSSRPWMF